MLLQQRFDGLAAGLDGQISVGVVGGKVVYVSSTLSPDDTLGATIIYLYREWLPASGAELRDYPVYVQRVSMFPDVPEHEAVTDVFLPLR